MNMSRWITKRALLWGVAATFIVTPGLVLFPLWLQTITSDQVSSTYEASVLSEHNISEPKTHHIPKPSWASTCSTPWSSPCFNRSRCLGSDGSSNFSIYALDLKCTMASSTEIMGREEPVRIVRHYPNAILKAFRKLALEKRVLAEKIEDACIIVYAITPSLNCVRKTPEWDMGRNHILFDLGDRTR